MSSKEAQQLHATGNVHKFSSSNQDVQGPCFHCDKSGHVASACWCKDMECCRCGKKGHVKRACWSEMSKEEGSKAVNKIKSAHFKKKRHVHTVTYKKNKSSSSKGYGSNSVGFSFLEYSCIFLLIN